MEKVTRVINMCECDIVVDGDEGNVEGRFTIPSQDACLYLKYVRPAAFFQPLHYVRTVGNTVVEEGAIGVSPAVECRGIDPACPGYGLFQTLTPTDAIIVSPRVARWLSDHRAQTTFKGTILAEPYGYGLSVNKSEVPFHVKTLEQY